MRDPRHVTMAIGFCPDQAMSTALVERYLQAVEELSGYYSPSAAAFWVDAAEPKTALHQALTAAVFENHRRPVEYLLIVTTLDRLDVQTVEGLRHALPNDQGCSLLRPSAPGGGGGIEAMLLPMGRACQLAETLGVTAEAAVDTPGTDDLLVDALAALGCEIASVAGPGHAAVHAPAVFRVPSDAHFLPALGSPDSGGYSLGELSARLGAAIGVIAGLAPDARVAVYGAGVIGRSVVSLLGTRVVLVIDRNPDAHGNHLNGVPVVAPSDLPSHAGEFTSILITVVGREPEIRATLAGHLAPESRVPVLDLNGQVDTPAPERPVPMARPFVPQTFEVPADMPPAARRASDLPKTRERTLTRRGVLYVGYPCNIRCKFCYYAHTGAKGWHSLDECTRDATLYRRQYGNTEVDITGGEPTIYPRIFDLLDHCTRIGLRPSLITNMQALRDEEKVRRFQDRGVYDFLCSIHGMGDVYNHITGTTRGWDNIVTATRHLNRHGVGWRVNCTTVNTNMRQLKDIAAYAYEYGARAINYISYNPFYEWSSKLDIDFQAKHSEIAPHLREALDYCDEVGLEANVRYMPFCQLRGHEDKAYNYSQLSYDHHEWDFASWYSDRTNNPSSKLPAWMAAAVPDAEALHLHLAQRTKELGFARPPACQQCAMGFICDGFTLQYVRRYGTSECQPYAGPRVLDPTHFIASQLKVVDEPAGEPCGLARDPAA